MSAGSPSPGQARYLRADRLLPGDVLLSRSAGKESAWIAWATFGPFSHAALYHSNYCMFESIDDGVGFAPLPIARACLDPGHGRVPLLDVSGFVRLEVRRHPLLAQRCKSSEDRRRVEDELAKCLVPQTGFEYPPLPRLARAVPYVPSVVALAILRVVARVQGEAPKVVPGMFCSQLVASALASVGAPPLKAGFLGRTIPPERMAPNRLRSRLTNLAPVPDVFVDAAAAGDDDGSSEPFLAGLRRSQSLTLRLANKHSSQMVKKSAELFDRAYASLKAFERGA